MCICTPHAFHLSLFDWECVETIAREEERLDIKVQSPNYGTLFLKGRLFVGGGERDQVELSQALHQEENKLQIRDCQRQLCSYSKNIFPFSKQNPKSCKIS